MVLFTPLPICLPPGQFESVVYAASRHVRRAQSCVVDQSQSPRPKKTHSLLSLVSSHERRRGKGERQRLAESASREACAHQDHFSLPLHTRRQTAGSGSQRQSKEEDRPSTRLGCWTAVIAESCRACVSQQRPLSIRHVMILAARLMLLYHSGGDDRQGVSQQDTIETRHLEEAELMNDVAVLIGYVAPAAFKAHAASLEGGGARTRRGRGRGRGRDVYNFEGSLSNSLSLSSGQQFPLTLPRFAVPGVSPLVRRHSVVSLSLHPHRLDRSDSGTVPVGKGGEARSAGRMSVGGEAGRRKVDGGGKRAGSFDHGRSASYVDIRDVGVSIGSHSRGDSEGEAHTTNPLSGLPPLLDLPPLWARHVLGLVAVLMGLLKTQYMEPDVVAELVQWRGTLLKKVQVESAWCRTGVARETGCDRERERDRLPAEPWHLCPVLVTMADVATGEGVGEGSPGLYARDCAAHKGAVSLLIGSLASVITEPTSFRRVAALVAHSLSQQRGRVNLAGTADPALRPKYSSKLDVLLSRDRLGTGTYVLEGVVSIARAAQVPSITDQVTDAVLQMMPQSYGPQTSAAIEAANSSAVLAIETQQDEEIQGQKSVSRALRTHRRTRSYMASLPPTLPLRVLLSAAAEMALLPSASLDAPHVSTTIGTERPSHLPVSASRVLSGLTHTGQRELDKESNSMAFNEIIAATEAHQTTKLHRLYHRLSGALASAHDSAVAIGTSRGDTSGEFSFDLIAPYDLLLVPFSACLRGILHLYREGTVMGPSYAMSGGTWTYCGVSLPHLASVVHRAIMLGLHMSGEEGALIPTSGLVALSDACPALLVPPGCTYTVYPQVPGVSITQASTFLSPQASHATLLACMRAVHPGIRSHTVPSGPSAPPWMVVSAVLEAVRGTAATLYSDKATHVTPLVLCGYVSPLALSLPLSQGDIDYGLIRDQVTHLPSTVYMTSLLKGCLLSRRTRIIGMLRRGNSAGSGLDRTWEYISGILEGSEGSRWLRASYLSALLSEPLHSDTTPSTPICTGHDEAWASAIERVSDPLTRTLLGQVLVVRAVSIGGEGLPPHLSLTRASLAHALCGVVSTGDTPRVLDLATQVRTHDAIPLYVDTVCVHLLTGHADTANTGTSLLDRNTSVLKELANRIGDMCTHGHRRHPFVRYTAVDPGFAVSLEATNGPDRINEIQQAQAADAAQRALVSAECLVFECYIAVLSALIEENGPLGALRDVFTDTLLTLAQSVLKAITTDTWACLPSVSHATCAVLLQGGSMGGPLVREAAYKLMLHVSCETDSLLPLLQVNAGLDTDRKALSDVVRLLFRHGVRHPDDMDRGETASASASVQVPEGLDRGAERVSTSGMEGTSCICPPSLFDLSVPLIGEHPVSGTGLTPTHSLSALRDAACLCALDDMELVTEWQRLQTLVEPEPSVVPRASRTSLEGMAQERKRKVKTQPPLDVHSSSLLGESFCGPVRDLLASAEGLGASPSVTVLSSAYLSRVSASQWATTLRGLPLRVADRLVARFRFRCPLMGVALSSVTQYEAVPTRSSHDNRHVHAGDRERDVPHTVTPTVSGSLHPPPTRVSPVVGAGPLPTPDPTVLQRGVAPVPSCLLPPCAPAAALALLQHPQYTRYAVGSLSLTVSPHGLCFCIPQLVAALPQGQALTQCLSLADSESLSLRGMVLGEYLCEQSTKAPETFGRMLLWALASEVETSIAQPLKNRLIPAVRQFLVSTGLHISIMDSLLTCTQKRAREMEQTLLSSQQTVYNSILALSSSLVPVPPENRVSELNAALDRISTAGSASLRGVDGERGHTDCATVNGSGSGSGRRQCVPPPTKPEASVCSIVPGKGRVMKSHERCPVMVSFDCHCAMDEGQDGDTESAVSALIFKAGDNVKQDQLVVQLFGVLSRLWAYGVFPVRLEDGVIEVMGDARSRDEIGHRVDGSLFDYFCQQYGMPGTDEFAKHRTLFLESLVPSSIASWVLQLKDRHNGNIMYSDLGRMLHIDFGFAFDIAPGGDLSIEVAPFKMTQEMVDILGTSPDSPGFSEFRVLTVRAFLVLRRCPGPFLSAIQAVLSNGMPCFKPGSIGRVQKRMGLDIGNAAAVQFIHLKIAQSANRFLTNVYDVFQGLQNKITY
ncbi:phosphatidylinositol Kinase [Kipferlia bialata]|uniref:Phosphatidylinositol Kinase n=1 Tax=Kipferlia bialata TaxID=797122 RepID=A0A9K3CW90_9EUKA|nr:phosphatidylinositol Kinase [Kipferlia bialata]|eukprot:g4624.t1